MPLYDYRCSKCQQVTEVRHGFDDAFAEPCPACGGALLRVFNPAPIVFKGSGFYVTDSRKGQSKSAESAPAKSEAAGAKDSASPAGSTAPASPAATPAPAAPATSGGESAA